MTGINPMVTPEELAEMMQIGLKAARGIIANHPNRVYCGGGQKPRYRLAYRDAYAILNGEYSPEQPVAVETQKPNVRRQKKPTGEKAKNGCYYAQRRK